MSAQHCVGVMVGRGQNGERRVHGPRDVMGGLKMAVAMEVLAVATGMLAVATKMVMTMAVASKMVMVVVVMSGSRKME